jgi:hypothetical protein
MERADRIARNLVGIAQASQRADGTDIPLGRQVREAAALIEAQTAEIRSLREQVARLQAIIDSRPAINAGLPETYIKWSQSVMLTEAAQAAGVVQ